MVNLLAIRAHTGDGVWSRVHMNAMNVATACLHKVHTPASALDREGTTRLQRPRSRACVSACVRDTQRRACMYVCIVYTPVAETSAACANEYA